MSHVLVDEPDLSPSRSAHALDVWSRLVAVKDRGTWRTSSA